MPQKNGSKVNGRRPLTRDDHKYSRGTVAIVAGSKRYPGAAVLTVGGARRGGVGYVKYLDKNSEVTALVLAQFPDVVPIANLHDERVDALVVGPGATTIRTLPEKIPVVLDSGVLSLARESQTKRVPSQIIVVTPHEGELTSLGFSITRETFSGSATSLNNELGIKNSRRQSSRVETAQNIANQLNVIVVLKGYRTVIAAPHLKHVIDTLGGPELAVAGSGDILAGLIGAFLASWKPENLQEAQHTVSAAVRLHSQAGKHASQTHSTVVATDILESLAHC